MLYALPWQALITGLVVLTAVAYLAHRWWPRSAVKAACHEGGGSTAAAGACGAGACAHCPVSTPQPPGRETRIFIQPARPE